MGGGMGGGGDESLNLSVRILMFSFLHPQVNYQPSPDIKAAFIILSFSEAHTSWKPFGKYLINIASINVMISNSLSAEGEEGRQENSNVSLAPASV